eukprot:TRINITY_DN12035_c0_g1_i1.p1 TRINITY_DN12035_c0_g1~~TRINITY_DN12035_c0_g1_i1.p1  ORF type:complete len:626 (+),score=60.84 TRINITY_DN12035_c0_g1_i1:42-1919(+)
MCIRDRYGTEPARTGEMRVSTRAYRCAASQLFRSLARGQTYRAKRNTLSVFGVQHRCYAARSPLGRVRPSSNHFENTRDDNYEDSYMDRGSSDYSSFELDSMSWDTMNLQQINKDIYKEHPEVSALSTGEADEIRKNHFSSQIRIFNADVTPVLDISHIQFSAPISSVFKQRGFTEPTIIQSQGWPLILSGRDMVGIAETGSGKTLTFALPAFEHIHHNAPQETAGNQKSKSVWGGRGRMPPMSTGPQALMIAPTRELAQQICLEITDFCKASGKRTQAFYGGTRKGQSMAELERYGPPDIAVATPGRLLDLLQSRVLSLENCTYFVVDEADRLLDMGFEPQLRQIVSMLRPDRQTLMWSATWPKEIQHLAKDFLTNPAMIVVGKANETSVANKCVTQEFKFIASARDRTTEMLKILERVEQEVLDQADGEEDLPDVKVLIFCETRNEVDRLQADLAAQGYPVAVTHGGKTQNNREQALRDFRNGRAPILAATDIAARGIDVKDITYVVNYSMPRTIDDYVHRIGRTGRAGAKGTSISLFSPKDSSLAGDLVKVLKQANQEIPDDLSQHAYSSGRSWGGSRNYGQQRPNSPSWKFGKPRSPNRDNNSNYSPHKQQRRESFRDRFV